MKHNFLTRLFVFVICAALVAAGLPITAFADDSALSVNMTEGDVIAEFAPEGTECVSSDPSVAWVDEHGCLCAMKPGTVTVSVPKEEGSDDYTVTVEDYSDGSEIVGNLKILARYNDSMQFYDGHVYLLFTSYQDGVEITVPDLYAGYDIADWYYMDIRDDISAGSNHTDNNAENYFTFNGDMKSVTLDRGQIVTIGMYRGFDLSVPEAALGSVKNSSGWTDVVNAGKTGVIETIFGFLDSGKMSAEEAVEKIKAEMEEIGVDYTTLLDGTVEGGVCFNRELYNQKSEWDQYENVTYEMDVTRNQLSMMTMYLRGNLNKFSILKNSCATVALRAWNAAVGTRGGQPTSYYLTSEGEGIFSMIDAPKSVRDSIRSRLPGYYLNNSEGVEEPDAGFTDETGWVYVSAPEAVEPVSYVYGNTDVTVNEFESDLTELIKIAKAGKDVYYNKDEQEITVNVATQAQGGATVINSIDFTVNGVTVSVDSGNAPAEGIWFNAKVEELAEGEKYYVTDADGKALASYYDEEEGVLTFCAKSLPASFTVVKSAESTRNILRTVITNGDKINGSVEIYTKDGENRIPLEDYTELESGTKVYVKVNLDEEYDYTLSMIAINYEPIFDDEHFDEEEEAYFGVMPDRCCDLDVTFDEISLREAEQYAYQLAVGEEISIYDAVKVYMDGEERYDMYDSIQWQAVYDPDGVMEINGTEIKAVREGSAVMCASMTGNENISVFYFIRVFESADVMATVTFSDYTNDNIVITVDYGDETDIVYSGYKVKKGCELSFIPVPNQDMSVLTLTANGQTIKPGENYTVTSDTEIAIVTVNAEITGMPAELRLSAKGETAQLEAQIKYTGLFSMFPVYDSALTYKSYDADLVTVDENGLVTAAGEIPEDGAVVYISADGATSANNLHSYCRVVLGDYKGDKKVGRMTISARTIHKGELIAHGAVTYTTYEDVDMDVSFHNYYRPNDKYNDLMLDYEAHPENYSSDPALCSDNELGLTDRESYFDVYSNGAGSEPQTISLAAGESFTVSNYGYDASNVTAILRTLEGSKISAVSPQAQALIEQLRLYIAQSGDFDAPETFDSLLSTIAQILMIQRATGVTVVDGHSEGGMDINREIFNQFRRNDSQMPNSYYTIEITADEFAELKAYMADPENNFYSLMAKNCATGAVDIWNTTLSDHPELNLTANLTGLAVDPQSLYFEIAQLGLKKTLDPSRAGEGGFNFYPRTVRYTDAVNEVMALIEAIGEVDASDECKERIDAAREAFDALSDREKERVLNKDELTAAEALYESLKSQDDINAYNEYLAEKLIAADALAQEGDSEMCQTLLEIGKTVIAARPYDGSMTLEENKAAVDELLALLAKTLELQRMIDEALTPKVLLGDADGDGEVTILDVTAIQRYLAGIENETFVEAAADVDGDGEITIIDATAIQRWLASMPTVDKINEPIV